MERAFLPHLVVMRSTQQAEWSFLAKPDDQPGKLRLYDKNSFTTYYVPVVEQDPTRCGWIVNRDDVPPRWRGVLLPA